MTTVMIRISFETAKSIWQMGDAEVYELYEDGTEARANDEALDSNIQYGIEGEMFGKPYDDPRVRTRDGQVVRVEVKR